MTADNYKLINDYSRLKTGDKVYIKNLYGDNQFTSATFNGIFGGGNMKSLKNLPVGTKLKFTSSNNKDFTVHVAESGGCNQLRAINFIKLNKNNKRYSIFSKRPDLFHITCYVDGAIKNIRTNKKTNNMRETIEINGDNLHIAKILDGSSLSDMLKLVEETARHVENETIGEFVKTILDIHDKIN